MWGITLPSAEQARQRLHPLEGLVRAWFIFAQRYKPLLCHFACISAALWIRYPLYTKKKPLWFWVVSIRYARHFHFHLISDNSAGSRHRPYLYHKSEVLRFSNIRDIGVQVAFFAVLLVWLSSSWIPDLSLLFIFWWLNISSQPPLILMATWCTNPNTQIFRITN